MVNSTAYYLLVLTWGLRYFWQKGNIREKVRWNRGLSHPCTLCIGVSRKFYAKTVCFFIVFLLIKRILRALFSFIPWLLNFSDLPGYGSNSRKRYTLRLLSMCLRRSNHRIEDKVPSSFNSLFDSLRWAPFGLALHLCAS